jgi:CheY-like chemotaxis protein
MSVDTPTGLAGCRVLLVEDEMLVAMSIEDALVEAGCGIVGPATTLQQALALLQNGAQFDVVVLDMNLDGQSGLPIADALAELAIPFVVLSGYGAAALAETRHRPPVLSKPFDPEQLLAILRGMLLQG